jgi:hypothetical protein
LSKCSVGSGTLKKYRGGGTAVLFFFKCGSGNGSGVKYRGITAVAVQFALHEKKINA